MHKNGLLMLGAFVSLSLAAPPSHAQFMGLVDVATISMSTPGTPNLTPNNVCTTDGTDLSCNRGVVIDSAGNVGVGTSAPSVALDVIGTTTWLRGDYLALGQEAFGRYVSMVSSSSDLAIWNSLSGTITLGTNNIRRLTLTSSGNVGLGTTSPNASLTIAAGEVQTASSGAACSGSLAGAIRYASGSLYYCNASAWTSLASAAASTPGGVSGSIQFNGGGTFAGRSDMVVDSSGNVGIGTSSPFFNLDVIGGVASRGNAGGFIVADRTTTYATVLYRNNNFTHFWENSSGQDQFTIDNSTGNVGIGTSTPNAKLEVNGTVSTTDVIVAAVGGTCASATDAGRMFRNATTGRMQMCVWR